MGFCFFGLAAAGGCYVGAPPRPRCARYDRYDGLTHPCRARCSAYSRYGVHESLHFLISRRASAPLHPLDGRETAVPPAEQARSAKRCSCGMQFARRTRTAKPKAEVCGHACLAKPEQQTAQRSWSKVLPACPDPDAASFFVQCSSGKAARRR